MIKIATATYRIAAALAIATAATATAICAAPPILTKVVVKWLDRQPTTIVFITDEGEQEMSYDKVSNLYSFVLPWREGVLNSWTMVARYGVENVPIELRVRRELPSLSFSLPRSEPKSCTDRAASRVSTPQDNVIGALRLALEARYLQGIPTPEDCLAGLRKQIVRAQLDRMNELIRRAPYFDIGQELQTAYAEINKDQPTALVALNSSIRVSQGIQAKEAYSYQVAAIRSGDLPKAASINNALIDQADKDPALRSGLAEARIDRLHLDKAILSAATVK